jgi:2-oxoglutarate ferredoxin oxidoreductase subunit delta
MKPQKKPLNHNEKDSVSVDISIDKVRCKSCRYCVEFCPRQVLNISSEIGPKGYNPAVVGDKSKCLACGFCEAICPEFAIKLSINADRGIETESIVRAAKKK